MPNPTPKEKWSSRKKCKWICLMGMVLSLIIILVGVIMSMLDKTVDDGVTYALIAWGSSITATFGLVVAGIHKQESNDKRYSLPEEQ